MPRSCATPTPRPPPRWPGPAATRTWPITCGSKRFGCHPAAATTRGPAPSGSSSATTPTPPPATKRYGNASSNTFKDASRAPIAWSNSRRDEFVGSLKAKPGLKRLLRRTKTGLLRIDRATAAREAHYDGKWLLRTSDLTLTPEDLAAAHKQLLAVERGWRDAKSSLGLRPVYHHREDRSRAHVQLCWLALLLVRVAETTACDTGRNLRQELDRMHLVTLATAEGRVAQRSTITASQKSILAALDLPEPPKYLEITTSDNAAAN